MALLQCMQHYSDEFFLLLQQPKSWLSLFQKLEQWVSGFLHTWATPTEVLFTSSTMPELHVLHDLSSTGRQAYLPISICNRAAPPFRLASRDLCTFTLVFCIYPSVEHALLQNYYFQLVMSGWILSKNSIAYYIIDHQFLVTVYFIN